jgi:3,4-dihydroxy-9,10-secoandrosta-1,3,5(10)-triene-9,17-dione 4,5-dioxygenase
MREISSLGYVVVSAADLSAWSEFGQHALGLQVAERPPGPTERETLFLRTDARAWRLAIEQGADGGVVALGFEVPDAATLDALAHRLKGAGHAVKEAPELAAPRGVAKVVRTNDPSGVNVEFFCGASAADSPFVSPTGAHFVTGSQGMGHAVMSVADVTETTAFYVDLLGFRLTDTITLGGVFELVFTSPSPRHHSIAYSMARPDSPAGHLHHVMLEVDDLDVVGRALDYCLDHQVPMMSMLGKHVNDHMTSFYCVSPSGLTIEYGFGGRTIDDATHQVVNYETASFWGHRPPDGRNMEEEIRNIAEAMKSGAAPEG